MVVFQFTTSIILIIGTIIVYKQLNYIQTKNLGFKKDQVLIVNGAGALQNSAEVFKNEVAKMSGVKSASFAGYLPVSNSARSSNTFSSEAVMDSKTGFNMQTWRIDYDYINTMGMEISKGRNFSAISAPIQPPYLLMKQLFRFWGMTIPLEKNYTPRRVRVIT